MTGIDTGNASLFPAMLIPKKKTGGRGRRFELYAI